MKLQFLIGVGALAFGISALSQEPTANDPNSGSRLLYNSAANTYSFKWWGKAGISYFIQQSTDLANWYYFPAVATGAEWPITLGFNAPLSDKLFVRVIILSYDPYNFDTDGDGMSDAYEVYHLLDYKVGDGTLDRDGDGIPNQEDADPSNANVGRLTVTITFPVTGSVLP